jgi:hypothetical protein
MSVPNWSHCLNLIGIVDIVFVVFVVNLVVVSSIRIQRPPVLGHALVQVLVLDRLLNLENRRIDRSGSTTRRPIIVRCYVSVPNPNVPNAKVPTRQIVDVTTYVLDLLGYPFLVTSMP